MSDMKQRLTFGPYQTADAALLHIGSFQNLAFPTQDPRSWGILWIEPGGFCALRQPVYDDFGDGLAVVYEWHGPVPPPAAPAKAKTGAHSTGLTLRQFFNDAAASVKAAGRDYVVNPAIKGYDAAHDWIVTNPKTVDSANVVLDLWGVTAGAASSFALFVGGGAAGATGVGAPAGAAAWVAGAGTVTATASAGALLVADGKHLYLEIFSDDTAVKQWESSAYYDKTEKIGPILALLDPLREGVQVLKAGRELKPLAQEIGATTREAGAASAEAAQAAADAARQQGLAAKAQTMFDKPGHVTSQVDQEFLAATKAKQAAAQADAARAGARAALAQKNLARLTAKAKALEKEITDYMAVRVHFRDATLVRDATQNGWSMGNYGLNNPYAADFGKIRTAAAPPIQDKDPLQALVPAHLNLGGSHELNQYFSIGVAAVGGKK